MLVAYFKQMLAWAFLSLSPSRRPRMSTAPPFKPKPLSPDFRDWNDTPFFSWMGLRVEQASNGNGRVVLDVQDHHRGGGGTEAVNGGVLAYMLDAVVGVAVHSSNPVGTLGQVTLSLNVEYLAPMMTSKSVVGIAKVIRRGGSLAFVDGSLYADDGTLATRAQAIMRIFRERPNSSK